MSATTHARIPAAASALVTVAMAFPPATALAEAPDLSLSWREPPGAVSLLQGADAAPAPASMPGGRGYDMEIGFRGRAVSIPPSILDIWYYNEDDPDWADSARDRPRLHGYGLGLEFVLKGDTANGFFYLDYLDSLMKEGYWDDIEEPPDHHDGDYLVPTPNLALVAFGADYGYEVHFVRTADTDGMFGLSFLVGGGLGVAFMVGEVTRWAPDSQGTPAFVLYDRGEPPLERKRIPRVYPMVDINASLRFNFGDRIVWRIEGGMHTLLYYGSSLGFVF